MKDKRIFIFKVLISIAVIGLIVAYFMNEYQISHQKIVVCITVSGQCDIFLEKEVPPSGQGGANCIAHPTLGKICRPNYVVFPLNVIVPQLKQTCEENGHGTFSGWNTCTRTQGVYTFDLIDQVWRKTGSVTASSSSN